MKLRENIFVKSKPEVTQRLKEIFSSSEYGTGGFNFNDYEDTMAYGIYNGMVHACWDGHTFKDIVLTDNPEDLIEKDQPEIIGHDSPAPAMRQFESGATRNLDENKLDFEGFLSPLVLERFAEYMHTHRLQADGKLRDSDNWQRGIPVDAYMKSMWRHFFDVWKGHRGLETPEDKITNLCALMFNVQGMLHELIKVDEKRKLEENNSQ